MSHGGQARPQPKSGIKSAFPERMRGQGTGTLLELQVLLTFLYAQQPKDIRMVSSLWFLC